MTTTTEQVRREDGEIIGLLESAPNNQWLALTVFGVKLGGPLDRHEAVDLLETQGLASLAEPWELLLGDDWMRVQIVEAAADRVTAQLADFNFPDAYGQVHELSVPLADRLRLA